MKRQGTYGFTFDSKAEEWAAWARGAKAIIRERALTQLAAVDGELCDDMALEARHSPAQPQNAPEIGVGSGRPVLTPVGRLNLVLIATSLGMAIALWKGWM